ncbi:MAG TPA: hypothetical protein VK436_13730 [Methanocella sp.]|nr:hypothetical protein [Methanocella sp.]
MAEREPVRKDEKTKKKRRKRDDVINVGPAEEPVRGPMGEDIYRV